MTPLTTDDWVSVRDFIGRYNWAVDEGQVEEWVSMWLPDGKFYGVWEEPISGEEQLREMARQTVNDPLKRYGAGMMRHAASNLHCDYLNTKDIVRARFYNHVTIWGEGSRDLTLAVTEMTLIRQTGGGWKVRSNRVRMLFPDGAAPTKPA